MKKYTLLAALLFLVATTLLAQTNSPASTFWHPNPRNYDVKQALEVESLVPMFLTGGYHFAVGYRYRKFRVRVSVINGGTFNADAFGITQTSTGIIKDVKSTDTGVGLAYQFFIGRSFYIQPGVHLYLRSNKTVDFGDVQYHIPTADITPVIRIGYRLWKQFPKQ
jgi:hypothetical protein